jgi:hypothetical protein
MASFRYENWEAGEVGGGESSEGTLVSPRNKRRVVCQLLTNILPERVPDDRSHLLVFPVMLPEPTRPNSDRMQMIPYLPRRSPLRHRRIRGDGDGELERVDALLKPDAVVAAAAADSSSLSLKGGRGRWGSTEDKLALEDLGLLERACAVGGECEGLASGEGEDEGFGMGPRGRDDVDEAGEDGLIRLDGQRTKGREPNG